MKNNCPHCKKEIEISEDKLGEVVTCDSCKTSFVAGSSTVRGSEPSGASDEKTGEHLQSDARDVEFNGAFYPLKTFRRLNRRFIAFSSLILLEIISFIAFWFHAARGVLVYTYGGGGSSASFMAASISFVALFIPLFVSYLLLLRVLREFDLPANRLPLYLYWFVPIMLVVCASLRANVFSLLVIPVFIADICYLVSYFAKAVRILLSARVVVPARGNPFVRGMKRYSFVLFPLLVILLSSAFFLGSQEKDARLCRNCGIWIDRDSICFLGGRLQSTSKYKPTVFSKYLDPEHRCSYHEGKTYLSGEETFMLDLLGVKERSKRGMYYHSITASSVRRGHIRDFLKNYSNIRDNSTLYQFLCEKDSPDYVRRLISFDLTSEEEEEFLRLFVLDWTGYYGSVLGPAEGVSIRGDISGSTDGSISGE